MPVRLIVIWRLNMDDIGYIVLLLFILLVIAKVLGWIFERYHMPALVGQILAGVIFINLVLFFPDFFHEYLHFSIDEYENDHSHFLKVMGELGIIFLLFMVGLETKFSDLMKVGKTAMYVAVLGIIIPFLGGLMFLVFPDIGINVAILIGTAMFAMSTGVTIECLRNLNAMNTTEAKIIVGAAVIDDILCLTLLAIVSGIVNPNSDIMSIAINTVIVAIFVIGMFAYISRIKAIADRRRRRLLDMKRRAGRIEGDLIIGSEVADHHEAKPISEVSALSLAIIVCLGMAALSSVIGLAGIIGAFLAGMIFAEFKDTIPCEHNFNTITTFLLPFFFIYVGMMVKFNNITVNTVILLIVMVIVAVITKYIGGYLGARKGGSPKDSSKLIGFSMIPRGEVGIIVATIGLSLGVFTNDIFTAVILMCLITSIIAPPLITRSYKKMVAKRALEAEEFRNKTVQ